MIPWVALFLATSVLFAQIQTGASVTAQGSETDTKRQTPDQRLSIITKTVAGRDLVHRPAIRIGQAVNFVLRFRLARDSFTRDSFIGIPPLSATE